jgi:hypothetical protein
MTPTFSLIYASARPHLIAGVVKDWESKCLDLSRIEWCIVRNEGDGPSVLMDTKAFGFKCYFIGQPHTRIRAYNKAAEVSSGHWLVCVADDWVPCDGWDEELEEFCFCDTHNKPTCILVHDRHKPGLMTHPIMSRMFYQQEGCFLNPEYSAWWADSDITETAKLRAQTVKVDLGFDHKHCDYGLRKRDSVDDQITDNVKAKDATVFHRRKELEFPVLTQPV